MRSLPVMTYGARQERAIEKKNSLLNFLASGEVYTSLSIASQVIGCSTSSAERTVNALVKNRALKVESHQVNSRKLNIYGISPHGLALVDVFDGRFFELGRTNSSYITHHLQTQQARLQAEAVGWTNWQPGKILMAGKGQKLPDAIALSPDGRLIAIEIERFVKTPKRYAEIISSHLQSIAQKKYYEVHYLCPPGLHLKVQKCFQHIKSVPVQGQNVPLLESHHARFKFYEIDGWPA